MGREVVLAEGENCRHEPARQRRRASRRLQQAVAAIGPGPLSRPARKRGRSLSSTGLQVANNVRMSSDPRVVDTAAPRHAGPGRGTDTQAYSASVRLTALGL